MLHAKELRYGNKVMNQQKKIITVQQILDGTVVYDTHMKVKKEVTSTGKGFDMSYSSEVVEVVREAEYHKIAPIALTPAILQKCGFRNFKREEWIVSYGNSHADFEFTDDGLKLRHPSPAHKEIRYLHQLQNFFYCLTGEELEVNV